MSRVQQVFFTIIRNGIQAICAKGSIKKEATGKDSEDYKKIRDQGGFEKVCSKKFSDPYFIIKESDEGDGLNLFIVDQIRKTYNAAISIESREGSGTTFMICFPIADQNSMG
ncbi:MAG: ATP-binding protein [Woeseia sp.]